MQAIAARVKFPKNQARTSQKGKRTMVEWVQNVSEWTEKHAGLGGWVGAVGAVFAIFVTWSLARAEYLRAKRQIAERRRGEIDLIIRIVSQYEDLIKSYKELGQNNPEASGFFNVHLNDPEWHSMRDLAFVPVTHWPSLEAYAEFKRYWYASNKFMEMAGITNVNKKEIYAEWQGAHDDSFSKLMNSLRSARRE